MEEPKVKKNGEWLVVLLIILGVVVAGLVIWIVIVYVGKSGVASVVDAEWKKNTECFENGTADDIDACVKDIYDSAAENYGEIDRDELVVGLYDKAIDAAMSKGDWAKARELMINKPNFFVLNDNCEKAMRILNESQAGRLEGGNEGVFYSYALDISISCNDKESIAKWNNLLSDYNEGVESGFGF